MRRCRPIFPIIVFVLSLTVIIGAPAWHAGSVSAGPSDAGISAGRFLDGATKPQLEPAQEDPPVWSTAGLDGGPIYDIEMSRETEEGAKRVQHLYAAGNQVFSSTRGITWTMLGDVPGANSLEVADNGVLLVGDKTGDTFRTRTYGKRWNQSRMRDRDDKTRYLAASPVYQRDGQAYGITTADHRLYRTDDQGQNWSEVVLKAGEELQAAAVAFTPLHLYDETLFLGTDQGVYRSQRSGDTWELRAIAGPSVPAFGADAGPIESQGMTVAFEWGTHRCRATDPDVRDIFAWNADGLWLSGDEAETWREIAIPAAVERLNDVVISPGWDQDRTILIAATGTGIVGAVSSDGGATWRTIAGTDGLSGTSVALSRDFWPVPPSLDCDPSPRETLGFDIFLNIVIKEYLRPTGDDYYVPEVILNREMVLATDGDGLWWSGDEGESWQQPAVQVQAVEPTVVEHISEDVVIAGSETAGLYRSGNGGETWSLVKGSGLPRGHGQAIHMIEASPNISTDRTVFLGAESGLWKSVDSGATWTRTSGPTPSHAIAISPEFASDGTLVSDGMISTDQGGTWSTMLGADDWKWASAAFSPRFAEDRTIWAGTAAVGDDTEPGREEERDYGLFVSTDAGGSWADIKDSDLRNRGINGLVALAVNASEPVRIIAATNSGIRMSTDGGENFERASEAGSRDVLAIDSSTVREPFLTAVIAGVTERGIIWSINRGENWSDDNDGPEDVRAITLRPDGANAVVTSHLTIWSRDLSLSPADATVASIRDISRFD